MSALLISAQICYAGAASSSELGASIEETKAKRERAHEIAEYVRSFGEPDSNPAIIFAKSKWTEQNKLLIGLYEEYKAAKAYEEEQARLAEERRKKGVYVGRFRISHYCPCVACNGSSSLTATGTRLSPWYTAAVDPSVIPLGSTFRIDGYGVFKAQDTGGAIRGNRIDICVSSHSEAMRLGVVYRDVYLVNN